MPTDTSTDTPTTPVPTPVTTPTTPSTTRTTLVSTNTATSSSSHSGGGTKTGPVIGGILATIVAIAILVFIGRKCFLRRREFLLRSQMYESGDEGGGMVEPYNLNNAGAGHRRTLSRGGAGLRRSDTINWNPDEPHLTPNVAPFTTNNLFPSEQAPQVDLAPASRPMSGLNQLSRYVVESWSPPQRTNELGMEMTQTATPAMITTANLGPARVPVPDAAHDLALHNEPAATAQPLANGWEERARRSEDRTRRSEDLGSKPSDSPFADKFSVKGAYLMDLTEPHAAALSPPPVRPPRPPRPSRPADLALEPTLTSPTSPEMPSAAVTAARHRLSISNVGPVPTVGHSRKISGPIPIMMPTSPTGPAADGNGMPWALHMRDDSRYPTLPSQSPPNHGNLAGVGSASASGSGVGGPPVARSLYPMAASKPSLPRHPSLRGKRTSFPTRPVMHQKAPSNGINSAINNNGQPSTPPKPATPTPIIQRRIAPNPASPPPQMSLPSVPAYPFRPFAGQDPDVPTTPTTPNIFPPSPPRSTTEPPTTTGSSSPVSSTSDSVAQIVTATVSMSSHAHHAAHPHPLSVQQSASTSELDLNDAYDGIASVSPEPSPAKENKPVAIETNHPYVGGAMLSPIIGSPRSFQQQQQPTAPPSPIASSHLASPTTPSRGIVPPPVPSAGLTRSNSASTAMTGTTADRMNTIIRREILQGVRAGAAVRAAQKAQAVAAGFPPQTPATPSFFPDQITNYHPPPGAVSSSAPAPDASPLKKAGGRAAVESWGMAPSLFNDGATMASSSARHMSANSGRRLSDITAGDAEWRELQRQLKWEQQ